MTTRKRSSRSRRQKPQRDAGALPGVVKPETSRVEIEQESALSTLRDEQAMAVQGAMLFQLREQLGLSQQALADLLEISLPSVSRYETQKQPLPFKVAAKLADLAHE